MPLAEYLAQVAPGFRFSGYAIRCVVCRTDFWSSQPKTMYCTVACRQRAYRERLRDSTDEEAGPA